MDFVGPADYFFWEGIEMGLIHDIEALDDLLVDKFTFNNHTTQACSEAFKWGFLFGQVITPNEYIDLTALPKPDVAEEVEIPRNKLNPDLVGNC